MKRLSVIILLLQFVVFQNVYAQNIMQRFARMPEHLISLLSENDRLDCIDFAEVDMRAVVINRLDGKSELKILREDYLLMQMTKSSTMQMKLLPCNNGDTITCVVKSVCVEACDSRISFYDKNWNELEREKYYSKPAIRDFFHPSDSLDRILKLSDIYLVKISLQELSDTLRAEYTLPAYMERADSAVVAPTLHPISYRWDGNRFVVVE